MKKVLFLTGILFTTLFVHAQKGSWVIRLNNKTILSARQEDVVKNVRTIKAAEWKKSGQFEIAFKEDDKDMWIRSFQFTDEQDNDLLRKDSTVHVRIPLAELRKLLAGKKQLIIYTTISPTDPNLAIRIRRVHLCTLQLP
jgi:hypothetical protein